MFAGQLMNWSMRTTSNTLTQLKAGIGSQLKLKHELFSGFLLKINIRHSPTNHKSESGHNMTTDDEFIAIWEQSGRSPTKAAQMLGINERNVYRRRLRIEQRLGKSLASANPARQDWKPVFENVVHTAVDTGHVIVFSDGHFWPGERTVAFEALLKLTKRMKPRVLIANGDMVDGASTNRHDPNGWSDKPSVKQEIETTAENLHEVRLAAPRGTQCLWNIGNHDLNFERRICTALPQYVGMPMLRLQDHFPDWEMQWTTEINKDVVVKHRWHNGIHAGYNNALKSGRTTVTGHLHRLLVTPWGDYNGRRWGVDTGTLSDPDGPQFEYTEYNPKPWCAGFAVLTFRDGKLMPPELVEVIDGRACFRGEYV